jgi:hypothetical protein
MKWCERDQWWLAAENDADESGMIFHWCTAGNGVINDSIYSSRRVRMQFLRRTFSNVSISALALLLAAVCQTGAWAGCYATWGEQMDTISDLVRASD